MSDRAALYAAVCANPDDDTPRLVFADWLQEHGEEKRAAFIRADIDVHNRENADTEAAHVYPELAIKSTIDSTPIDWSKIDPELAAIRAADVAARNMFAVKPKTEGVPRMKGIRLFAESVRGFLSCIVADHSQSFLKHADAIFRHAPITDVTFERLVTDDACEIVKRGLLARIRELVIWNMDDPGALVILGNHPDAAGVRSLNLHIGDDYAELVNALIRCKHWTGLRRLALFEHDQENELPAAHQTRLFRQPVFAGLQELIAWGDVFGDATARAIAAGGMPELRHLDLSISDSITSEGLRAIARSKGLAELRYLDVCANNAADAMSNAELIASPQLANLTVLKLSGDGKAGLDAKVLAKPGRGPGLRMLELSSLTLDPAEAQALVACPAVRKLWYLTLRCVGLTSSRLEALLRGPGFDELAFLDLPINRLDAKAARTIANWSSTALQWLDLSNNPLTANGLAALADSPHLAGLKYLQVSGKPTTAGFKKLKKRFGKALKRAT
jgi:uncharacterized protein (TIGR02996 family)